jgi:hypothetical protein
VPHLSHTKLTGCPSIRAKVLSSKNCPWRCVSIVLLAREVCRRRHWKAPVLESPLSGRFCYCFCLPFHQPPSIRPNHDHDSSMRTPNHLLGATGPVRAPVLRVNGQENAQSILRQVLSLPGAPASGSRCERPPVTRVGAKHPVESYSQLACRRHLDHQPKFPSCAPEFHM